MVFWSYLPNGVVDLRAFHGGCPVLDGVKWMGQQWILGVPFVKSEWSTDSYRKSKYNQNWFHESAVVQHKLENDTAAAAQN